MPHKYYLLKKYEVLKSSDVFRLIRRLNANEDPIYFATLEAMYDIIKRAHIATGHGGHNKMVKELTKKYANITHDTISIYKSLCIKCHSYNELEFTASVITDLKLLWPDLVMVHRKPRHPQSQGSVERTNCDIKHMLVAGWVINKPQTGQLD
ncbi:KRAB-A domain-containing protein 2-like [Oratosquilla oratoria]|uniref:KRAB-A domain-containing protein 2-like n=1 Tax=Oratosquilla oratoria TaxID=337810 RepID=UPI003F76CCF0